MLWTSAPERQVSDRQVRAERPIGCRHRVRSGGTFLRGELALAGHAVTIFEKRALPGGLSTYGIITLREPAEVAVEEARMIERLGVTIKTGREFGKNVTLEELQRKFDAVVLAVGFGSTTRLGIRAKRPLSTAWNSSRPARPAGT